MARFALDALNRLRVVTADALTLTDPPTRNRPALANLPTTWPCRSCSPNPCVLPEPQWGDGDEVRSPNWLCATPGRKLYGVPSVKVAWYADVVAARPSVTVGLLADALVDSGLVRLSRHTEPQLPGVPAGEFRATAFAAIDAAFGQRRAKCCAPRWLAGRVAWTAPWGMLKAAGIDPGARGETLTAADFARLSGEKLRARPPGRGVSVPEVGHCGSRRQSQPRAGGWWPSAGRIPRGGHGFQSVGIFDEVEVPRRRQ